VDGVSVEVFHEQALSRLAELRCAVQEGRYRPQPLLGVTIPKPSGGQRLLAIPTVIDRVLQTAVAQLLTRLLDPDFDDASFAYRSGRSVRQAIARIIACRDQGLCSGVRHLTPIFAPFRKVPSAPARVSRP
jgi:retron-type reverse transcriptase